MGVWLDGENPGAGSQSVDSTGLNGNFIKTDTAIGTEHNPNGTHKSDVISGENIKNTIVDGSTLEASATTGSKVFRIKDGGVTGIKLNANVVDGSTLEIASNVLRVKDAGITGAKLATSAADASTLEVASGSMRIKAAGVTAPKISHDNKRTRQTFTAAFASVADGTYAKINGELTTASLGIGMPQAGSIISYTVCDTSGTVGVYGVVTYGTKTFNQYDRITFRCVVVATIATIQLYKNGSSFIGGGEVETGSAPIIVTLEVEFND